MPRLRVIRKPNESASIPETEAISVEVGHEADAPQADTDALAKQAKEAEDARKAAEDAARQAQDADRDQEVTTLKKQLEDLQKAADEARKMAEEAEQRRQDAIRQTQDHERNLAVAGNRAESAELDAILNAISAAESEAASAERDYENAQAAQDWKAAAESQRRLARAETRLVQLEDGKVALEARREFNAQRFKEQQQRPPQPRTPEEYIDSLINLMPSQRAWLKAHAEVVVDQRKAQRLAGYVIEAEDGGLVAGSDAYFKFLDTKMGYRKAESEEDEEDMKDASDTIARGGTGGGHDRLVSAPVTRDPPSTSGRTTPTRITLTPAQREAAKAANISEVDYARQLMRLQQEKREGRYL